jgi:hypothetical protein
VTGTTVRIIAPHRDAIVADLKALADRHCVALSTLAKIARSEIRKPEGKTC